MGHNKPPYYLTAYGLAVKEGFKGTLAEWLASLHGDGVQLRYQEEKLQWRSIKGAEEPDPEEGWQDLLDVAGTRQAIFETAMNGANRAEEAAGRAEGAAKQIVVDQEYIETQVFSAGQAAETAAAAARDAAQSEQNTKYDADRAVGAADDAEAAKNRAEEVVGSTVSYNPQSMSRKQQAQAMENMGVSPYYHTTRKDLVIEDTINSVKQANADYIWSLYDALMKAPEYSGQVKKLVWIDDTASWSYVQADYEHPNDTFFNYAYEISTREYPTDGLYASAYEPDPQIKKPKYLILSGIHGDERKTCLSTYRFIRDVLGGHNVPQSFREGVTLCVMPVGTPSAIDNFNRPSKNDVDINRNFDWHWESGTKTSDLYGTYTYGTSAASEKETQAIVKWLASHTDADLFIDFHNSGQIQEQVVIMGLADTQKKIAMRGIDRIIPYWKDVIGYPKNMTLSSDDKSVKRNVIFSYTATAEIAGAHCYAQEVLGINSLAMETAVFYPTVELTHAKFKANRYLCPPETIAMGAEALGNILIEFYNQADMASQAGVPIYNGEAVLNINTKTHAQYNGEVE